MKIISGFLKNRKIPTAKSDFRPSTGRFKEALFSILSSGEFEDFSFEDKNVLDLFCGSCSIGFEAISRGAKSATFIDINNDHLKVAENFAKKVEVADKVKFLNMDAANLGKTNRKYDFVFMDPPYGNAMAEKTLHSLKTNSWLDDQSFVIIEIGKPDSIAIEEHFQLLAERIYGNSKMIILTYIGG